MSVSTTGIDRLRRLYDDHADEIYGYAVTRVGETVAEDITAEVFHAAAVALADGRSSQVTVQWLMGVAHNKVVDEWRRSGIHKRKQHLLVGPASTVDFPSEWVATAARREAVLAALDALPPHYRAALIMRHLEGHSVPLVAEELSLTVRAAESLLARARKAFQMRYGDVRR